MSTCARALDPLGSRSMKYRGSVLRVSKSNGFTTFIVTQTPGVRGVPWYLVCAASLSNSIPEEPGGPPHFAFPEKRTVLYRSPLIVLTPGQVSG